MLEPAQTKRHLRVYIAGGSAERFMVRNYMDRLRAAGIEIAYDWTRSTGFDRPFSESESRDQARLDLEGVRACDLLWYMAPTEKSEGSHGELVGAWILGKHILVSGPHLANHRIFPLLAAPGNPLTHNEAFELIVRNAAAFM